MPQFRVYWVSVENDGCFSCEAADLKNALTESINHGICSLDWTEAWEDCGDHWEIHDLVNRDRGTRTQAKCEYKPSPAKNKAEVSLELLYHFRCASCRRWWSVGDFEWDPKALVCCPHCGEWHELPEKPEAHVKISHPLG